MWCKYDFMKPRFFFYLLSNVLEQLLSRRQIVISPASHPALLINLGGEKKKG